MLEFAAAELPFEFLLTDWMIPEAELARGAALHGQEINAI
jgi:hypothetical protein